MNLDWSSSQKQLIWIKFRMISAEKYSCITFSPQGIQNQTLINLLPVIILNWGLFKILICIFDKLWWLSTILRLKIKGTKWSLVSFPMLEFLAGTFYLIVLEKNILLIIRNMWYIIQGFWQTLIERGFSSIYGYILYLLFFLSYWRDDLQDAVYYNWTGPKLSFLSKEKTSKNYMRSIVKILYWVISLKLCNIIMTREDLCRYNTTFIKLTRSSTINSLFPVFLSLTVSKYSLWLLLVSMLDLWLMLNQKKMWDN